MLRFGGAAYLIVLGVQSVRRWWRVDDGARVASDSGAAALHPSGVSVVCEGLLTNGS